MLGPIKVAKLPAVNRSSYVDIADRICRSRMRGCPRLLEKLMGRLSQTRHLYLFNVWWRGGGVPSAMVGRCVRVHRGRKWRILTLSAWHGGFQWGAFARTRRIAAFKSRAASKKKKRTSKGAQMVSDMRVLQFRALQLGQRRRTSVKSVLDIEAHVRGAGI